MSEPIRSIVVLTGAGVSAESGIKTFRAADGLWEEHRIDDVATPEGFENDPHLVHNFYNALREKLLSDSVKPNRSHHALAEFEQAFQGSFLLITQNIDNLHERAGSKNVIHMHGELLQIRCRISQKVYIVHENTKPQDLCHCCNSTGNLRPNIVWFGEMPFQMNKINRSLENCDLFIAIGTSGNVYPASGFYQTAKIQRAHTVELNLEKTASRFDENYYGLASEIVPHYLESLLRIDEVEETDQ